MLGVRKFGFLNAGERLGDGRGEVNLRSIGWAALADWTRLKGFKIRVTGVTACGDGCTAFLAELVNSFALIDGVFDAAVASGRF